MTDQKWKAAGVIPIAIYNKQLYVLLGREAKDRDKGKYDAFGGGRDKKDKTPKDTAVRECYEESMGFFGSQAYIQKTIKQLMPGLDTDFVLKMDYSPYTLPKLFNDVHKYMKSGVIKTKRGYLEKDQIRWFPVNKKQNTANFRNYFKKMFKYMIENHDDIVNRFK